jgi:hypothetical protein
MEAPRSSTKKKPVTALIADGGELRARLLEAAETRDAERVRLLEKVVQPYLQLVESEGFNDKFPRALTCGNEEEDEHACRTVFSSIASCYSMITGS